MTPLDPPTRTYLIEPGRDAADVVDELARRLARSGERATLHAEPGEAELSTRTVLDTADRRLRAAGLDLAVEGTGGPGPERRLVLRAEDGSPPVQAPAGSRTAIGRYLVGDLPEGRLRQRLAPILEVRALLPVVELRRRAVPVAVCNRDGKTVVRLLVTDVWALPAGAPGAEPPVRLSGRLDATGVLGYPKPFARVEALVRDRLRLVEAATAVADEAVLALGGDPAGISSKLDVPVSGDEPAEQAARRILDRLADIVEANLPGTLDDLDPEFLHDLRVAIRRSRSVLRELKSVFDPDARREQADVLRGIQAITGPTRDLDVQIEDWDGLVAQLPPDRQRDLEPARVLLGERRALAFRAMRTTLRTADQRRRWEAWRKFVASGPGSDASGEPTLEDLAGRRVRKVYKRMVRDGRRIGDDSPAQELHDLRKRGKELRYLLEMFGSLWPAKQVKPMVSALKQLQDVLGRHQDHEVQAENLRSLAPELAIRQRGAASVLALGGLVDRLEEEQHQARAQFVERFAAFADLEVPG